MAITTAAAILGSAIIGGGAAVLGGRAQERAVKRGAAAQVSAAEQAATTQREQFQQTRADLTPFREIGGEALQTLGGLLGLGGGAPGEAGLRQTFTGEDLAQDPGFQFRLGAGREAVERGAAARGGLLAGRTGEELVQFGQELGSQEFGRAFERFRATQGDLFSRLFAVSEAGRGAAGATGQFGAQAAGRIGQAQLGVGQAQAQGAFGVGQARQGVFTGLANIGTQALSNVAFQNLLNQPTAMPTTTAPRQTFTGLDLQPELRTAGQRRITL